MKEKYAEEKKEKWTLRKRKEHIYQPLSSYPYCIIAPYSL